MASQHIEEIRKALAALSGRLASGEIDEEDYHRRRQLILDNLTPEEQQQLGTAPPKPSGSGARLGPSGAVGSAVRTALPSLADLDLEPGAVLFQQWRIVRELGRGGFGVVFEANELHLDQRQAVKVLDPAMVARAEFLGRFRREVALMRQLIHPRIVRVYDYREDLEQSQALISMELIRGGSVKELGAVARGAPEPVPLSLIFEILRQTIEALAMAHSQGVVHRDVTPGNILLAGGSPAELLADPERDPGVKLVDFGIAALVKRSELSQRSQVLGTAAYVAPEILDPSAGGQGSPADVYGLGAVAYELLTGEPPLARFEEPSALRPGLPAQVDRLILAMLERRPQKRPSGSAVLEECRRVSDSCKEDEKRWQTEEEAKRLPEAQERRRRAELQAERRVAEEEKRRQAEAEAKRRAEEDEKRRQAEAEAKRRAEEDEKRRQAEAEAKRRAEEDEKRRQAEAEAKRRAEEDEKRRQAEAEAKRRFQAEEKQRQVEEAERGSALRPLHVSLGYTRGAQHEHRVLGVRWIVGCVLGGLVGGFIATIGFGLLTPDMSQPYVAHTEFTSMWRIERLPVVILVACVFLGQWLALRHRWTGRVHWWIPTSIIAWVLADLFFWSRGFPLAGAAVGLIQSLLLWRRVKERIIWFLVGTASWALPVLPSISLCYALDESLVMGATGAALRSAIGLAAVGAMTGVCLFALSNRSHTRKLDIK